MLMAMSACASSAETVPMSDDHDRLRGSIEKVLQKGALTRDRLLAEVGTLLAGLGRPAAGG